MKFGFCQFHPQTLQTPQRLKRFSEHHNVVLPSLEGVIQTLAMDFIQ